MTHRALSLVVVAVTVMTASPAPAQFSLYYGNFHSHCNLSDDAVPPPSGPPSAAFTYARDVAGIDILAITTALMVGTAGLPHVLIRFYTVPSARAARWSVMWALVFIALLYTTAPAVSAFARVNLIQTLHETPYAEVPSWFTSCTFRHSQDLQRGASCVRCYTMWKSRQIAVRPMKMSCGR